MEPQGIFFIADVNLCFLFLYLFQNWIHLFLFILRSMFQQMTPLSVHFSPLFISNLSFVFLLKSSFRTSEFLAPIVFLKYFLNIPSPHCILGTLPNYKYNHGITFIRFWFIYSINICTYYVLFHKYIIFNT